MEEGSPYLLPNSLALVATDPIGSGDVFELRRVFAALEEQSRNRESSFVEQRKGLKTEKGLWRSKIPQSAFCPDAHPRGEPVDEVGDSEFLSEIDVRCVARKEVVIKRFEGFASDLHDTGETTGARIPLKYLDLVTCLGQPKGRCQTGETRSYNSDITHEGATFRIVALRLWPVRGPRIASTQCDNAKRGTLKDHVLDVERLGRCLTASQFLREFRGEAEGARWLTRGLDHFEFDRCR